MPNEIFISRETYTKMFAYAEIANKTLSSEVGGYLVINELDTGGLLVEDIILPEQTVSGGSFKAKPGIKCPPEIIPKIKGWWHSHGNMGTFHSGTDDSTLGDKWNGETKNSPNYAVSIVVALPNKMLAYLQYFRPIITEKIEIPVSIVQPISKEIYEKCEAEVKQLVSKENFFLGYQNYNQGDVWSEEGRTELPEKEAVTPLAKDTPNEKLDEEEEKILDEESCDAVIDHATGLSVTQLKEQGMWSPEKYDKDLFQEVEKMKRLLRDEYITLNASPQHLKIGECPHISLNAQSRQVCFMNGRNYDCRGCIRNPKNIAKANKGMESPIKNEEKKEVQVTITEVEQPKS
jgi:hypothetical protein